MSELVVLNPFAERSLELAENDRNFADTLNSGDAEINLGSLTIGNGTAGEDYYIKFDGEDNDGTITWMEDEAYFDFSHPIVISDQSLLGTPVMGALEFDNDRLYITDVATQRAITRSSSIETSTTTVTDTVTETTIYTSPLPANSLKVGNHIHLNCNGIITNATAADDITINLYVGTDLIETFNPAIGNVTNADWHIELEMTVRTVGAAGTIASHGHIAIDGNDDHTSELDAVDTTGANDITLTVIWDNAKAGNIISLYQCSTIWHN